MKPIRYITETGSADALIFNQIEPQDARVAYLMERRFPFATHGRSDWADRHAWADFDNRSFGRLGVEALAARGRRRLILIAPPQHQTYGRQLVDGAEAEARARSVRLTIAEQVTSDGSIDEIRAWTAAAVAADPEIDGLICGSTNATMAAVAGMESEGFDVGTDIEVFAKEAIPFLKLFRERILVVHEDVRGTGERLALAAIQAIKTPDLPPLQHLDMPQGYQ